MTREDMYSIGEVAAILGVSTHTVRAWERRHGMVKPHRTEARHRRYRSEDVALLRKVKQAANLRGVSLRLAYESVNAAQPLRPKVAAVQSRPPEQVLASSDGNLWRALIDVMPQFVAVIDAEGAIVESNIVAAKAFGVVLQSLRRRPLLELVDRFDRRKAQMLYRPALRAVTGWDLNLATPEGARTYSFQTWFVRHDQGMLLALVGSKLYEAASPLRRLDG